MTQGITPRRRGFAALPTHALRLCGAPWTPPVAFLLVPRSSSLESRPLPGSASSPRTLRPPQATANPRTKILDLRGFDSSRIFSLTGGILMSIGNFPESLSQQILAGIFLVGRLGVPHLCRLASPVPSIATAQTYPRLPLISSHRQKSAPLGGHRPGLDCNVYTSANVLQ